LELPRERGGSRHKEDVVWHNDIEVFQKGKETSQSMGEVDSVRCRGNKEVWTTITTVSMVRDALS